MLCQAGIDTATRQTRLEDYRSQAEPHAAVGGGIAVLSDFRNNRSYIYSGSFGKALDMPPCSDIDSAFEDCIFSFISSTDLTDRHILELRFFEFLKTLPIESRTEYIHSCRLNVTIRGKQMSILHTTRYLDILPNGCVTIGLCVYTPFGDRRDSEFEGYIINLATGESFDFRKLEGLDDTILSPREREVLSLLSEGYASKQIADKLHISPNTVYRHRQNILQRLNVVNTAEAVKIGLRMHII